jgi:hypothetical protein
MKPRTDDLRIKEIKELLPPAKLLADLPITDRAAETVYEARQAIHRILHGADDRLLVIMGPCSIHDVKAAKEYAGKLKEARDRVHFLFAVRVGRISKNYINDTIIPALCRCCSTPRKPRCKRAWRSWPAPSAAKTTKVQRKRRRRGFSRSVRN